MTLEGFVKKYDGKKLDVSGTADAMYQCVDLANGYLRDVLNLPIIEWTNAKDFPSRAGDNFDYIKNIPEGVPQKGDLVIWRCSAYGHIAIFLSGNVNWFTSFDQNWPIGSPCHKVDHAWTNVIGWMRPKGEPMTDEDLATDAKNWKELRKRSLDWNLKDILGHETIESVEDCEKVFNIAKNLKTDSNNWKAVCKIYQVESVEALDKMITDLKNSSPCDKLLKKKDTECVKRIEDLKETHEEQIRALRRQIPEQVIDPYKLTNIELLLLFLGFEPKEFKQNKKENGENVGEKK